MRSRHEKAAATTQTVATARASERRNALADALHGEVLEALLPQEPRTQHFTLDDGDSVPELVLSRPDKIATLSGPQERVQRRTMQQIVDVAPLPYLDDPMPQMVEQSVEVLHFFLQRWPVAAEQTWNCEARQVIDVPNCTPQRLLDTPRQPQMLERLVEVPTIISFSSLQWTVEQNDGIPVVGGSGAGGGLSSCLPGPYSMTAEQIVDIPVPRRRFRGDLQGLHRGQSSTAFLEQIADPGGGLQDFQPVQGPPRLLRFLLYTLVYGVFALFLHPKKVRRSPARWMTICPGTSAHPRRRLMRLIMLLVMTSGCRS